VDSTQFGLRPGTGFGAAEFLEEIAYQAEQERSKAEKPGEQS